MNRNMSWKQDIAQVQAGISMAYSSFMKSNFYNAFCSLFHVFLLITVISKFMTFEVLSK